MKATIEILNLGNKSDTIHVHGQGSYATDATWRAQSVFGFDVPEHIGRKFTIGQVLEIEIKPKRKKGPQ